MRNTVLRIVALGFLLSNIGYVPAMAMGHKPDYQNSPNYAPNRVQRGSPANPNAAFSPPQWDNTPAAAPASTPPPVTTHLTQPKLGAQTNPDNLPLLEDNGSSTSNTVPLRTTPLPPPSAKPAPADASEPALPDDTLNSPSNQTEHPPAQ